MQTSPLRNNYYISNHENERLGYAVYCMPHKVADDLKFEEAEALAAALNARVPAYFLVPPSD
jgi:hypothetical protein